MCIELCLHRNVLQTITQLFENFLKMPASFIYNFFHQFICSYVFYPLAFLMGVDTKENNVFKVAELIGYKTFINEFYAYEKLSVYINNRENLTWYESLPTIDNSTYTGRWRFDGDDIVYSDFNHTLKNGVLTVIIK